MKMLKFRPVLEVFLFAVVAYIGHKTIIYFSEIKKIADNFQYSLETIYGFFLLCSLAIIAILTAVKQRSIDNVGNVFLLLTFIKMGLAYFIIYPVMQSNAAAAETEKMNFFIIFGIFLAIETAVSVRILNTP